MRLPRALLVALAAAGSAAAFAFASAGVSFSLTPGKHQKVIADSAVHPVPGHSPLQLCDGDRAHDILQIDRVDLLPNPPESGKTLVITAIGRVSEDIEKGAYVVLQVNYGLIRLVSTRADLCDQVRNVDLECPIEKGVLAITKAVDLPKEIPPGKYTVLADVYTKDGKHITCLTAEVVFGQSRDLFADL